MNLLSRTMPWVVASVIAATSAFGEEKCCPELKCTPCEFKEMTPGMAGHNASSAVQVCKTWDVYAAGSFLYWQAIQENMEYAFVNSNWTTQITSPGTKGAYVVPNFQYKTGFKVGVGGHLHRDNWDTSLEYTRFHSVNTTATNGFAGGYINYTTGNPSVLGSNIFFSASQIWRCNLDFVDASLGRDYFVGTQLTFHPVVGARAAWILQKVTTQYTNPGINGPYAINQGNTLVATSGTASIYQRIHSWGFGPRMGLDTSWMIGKA